MHRALPAAVALALFGLACGTPAARRVSLAEPPASETGPDAGARPLRVAVAAMASPSATIDGYTPLFDYLAAHLDQHVRLVQRPTYAEVNELLRLGAVDLAFVCTGAYVEGERQGAMELLVAPVVAGAPEYYALIVVPAGSRATTLDDLRDRVFAFTDPLSNSGHLAVHALLRARGVEPEDFFRSTFFTYSHDNSIRAVADGVADGASVDSLVYAFATARHPELAAKTRVILRLGPYGMPPVVVPAGLAPARKAHLRQVFLGMREDPAAQPALRALGIEGFVVPDRAAYDAVRAMAASVRRWR